MFFILVHSNFYGIPLPDHVSYTKQKVNNKFHRSNTTCYYDFTFRKNIGVRQYKQEERQWRATGTQTCASTVSTSTTNWKIAEPGFKANSPVRMPEAGNIGQGNTLMRKRLKDLSHQFQRSQTTSHH
jgi:hypothetical protein